MNLQPVPIEEIPIGKPLPWPLYDRGGCMVLARGDMVAGREQLQPLLTEGLMRDADESPQGSEKGDSLEFGEELLGGLFPPAGIKPPIGEHVQIRLLNRNPHAHYVVRLIGYVDSLSILMTMPVVDGSPLILAAGELVEIRMVTGSNIYWFQTQIQHLCSLPLHYMHLNYPDEVRTQKLRKSPWARVNVGVTVASQQGTHEHARLVNLSTDGAKVHAPTPLGEVGAEVRLSFHTSLDDLKTTLNLEATILHVRPISATREEEEGGLEYGLAFRNVVATDTLWLKGVVYRHIAEGDLI